MGAWISLNQFKFFRKKIIGFLGIGSAPSRATGAGLGRVGPHDLALALAHPLRPPPYHPGLPRKGRIYVLAPARWEDSRAIEPYRILEAGASLGLPERPEMRDTLLFSIKKDARSAKIQLQSNPHLRTHKISPGVRRSCPPRGCYPGTTGRSYGHLGVS